MQLEVIRWRLESDIDSFRGDFNREAWHAAAESGSMELLRRMIAARAESPWRTEPLHEVAGYGSEEQVSGWLPGCWAVGLWSGSGGVPH